jgi:putative endonuclease
LFVIPRNEESGANNLSSQPKQKPSILKPQSTPGEQQMHQRLYYVYILTNQHKTVLYTGVTNNLKERILQHYQNRQTNNSFSGKYAAYLLLFYEGHQYINNAITREKEIKGWIRKKKWELISNFNPEAKFLNEELFGEWPPKEDL